MNPSLFRYVWENSRAEQLFLFFIILLSLPFYWISLDVPKQIVNQAIQGGAFRNGNETVQWFAFTIPWPAVLGGGSLLSFDGFELSRVPFLMALSFWFLALVLINGAFKYFINIRKGILGERMLRRLRFDLFAILMRFRPEDIATLKPAEVAGMIKDEVEPIGGFIGDAFIQPAFLATQAATALIFIMVQSPSMGLAALAIVLVQAIVIPILRREQIRLGRQRQIASRRLAGRIGEVIENADTVHTYGATLFVEADIGDRLGGLFTIRSDLFRRKFAVKFLNNILAQVTPFVFYSVGGYLALKGKLDIGQLVAVIAAYRDLPPPIKDLIDWDQQRQDVAVKYEQVVQQFSPPRLLAPPLVDDPPPMPAPDAPIVLTSVSVRDARSASLLDRLSLTLDRPSHIALVGDPGSGREVLARILGRQTLNYEGKVTLGGTDMAQFPDLMLGTFLHYVGSDPRLTATTIRDNILFATRSRVPAPPPRSTAPNAERLRQREAQRSGNPLFTAEADWTNYEALGISGPDEVDGAIHGVLEIVGALPDIYRLGVLGRFDDSRDDAFLSRFVEARRLMKERLAQKGMSDLVEPFNSARYNLSASVAENLIFGVAVGKRLQADGLPRDPFLTSILAAEALLTPLIDFGLRLAELAVDTFAGLPPEHPVFERYSAIRPEDLPRFAEIVESVKARGSTQTLSTSARAKLLGVGLAYVEPRHRLGLIDEAFKERVLRARASFRAHLPVHYGGDVEFYSEDRYIRAAPVGDNILFGRVAYGIPNAFERIYAQGAQLTNELGIDRDIFRLGLEFEVGKAGWHLQPTQRSRIALARALMGMPQILVIDNALAAFLPGEAARILADIRKAMDGRTLIVTVGAVDEAAGFDRVIAFEGPRIRSVDIVAAAQ